MHPCSYLRDQIDKWNAKLSYRMNVISHSLLLLLIEMHNVTFIAPRLELIINLCTGKTQCIGKYKCVKVLE